MTACNGAIKHSGDEKTGAKEGDDEVIKIDLDALPVHVKVIMFVVNAYSGGNLKHVETARAQLRDLTPTGNKQALCDMRVSGHGTNTALILCALVRNEG